MIKKIRINKYLILYILTIALYIVIRLDHVVMIEEPKYYPDSYVYLSIADSPVTFTNYFVARVPFVTPLVFKILCGNPEKIAFFNTFFSIFSWTLLAFAVSNFTKGTLLRWLSFSSILFFSLNAEILLFDWIILSESLSLSLMIVFISSWMFFIANGKRDWRYTLLVVLSGFLWIFTRDTNALLVLGLAVFLLLLALSRKSSYPVSIIGVVFLSFCVISTQLGNISGRWIPPYLKVIEQRILTDADSLAFFQANGILVLSDHDLWAPADGGHGFDSLFALFCSWQDSEFVWLS